MSEASPTKVPSPSAPVASIGACACSPDRCACEGPGRPVRAEAPLTKLEIGHIGLITRTTLGSDDEALLRAMGLRPNARIRLCQAGEPWIIEVRRSGGACSRIGLARAIAEHVHVGPT